MASVCFTSSGRLGLLGDEPVPTADSIVGALAKHMEMNLPFGMRETFVVMTGTTQYLLPALIINSY